MVVVGRRWLLLLMVVDSNRWSLAVARGGHRWWAWLVVRHWLLSHTVIAGRWWLLLVIVRGGSRWWLLLMVVRGGYRWWYSLALSGSSVLGLVVVGS